MNIIIAVIAIASVIGAAIAGYMVYVTKHSPSIVHPGEDQPKPPENAE